MRPNLLKLLADNRGAPRRFEVKSSGDEATLYLYDAIVSDELMAQWLGGVAPESFVKALNAIDAPTIHLRVNSPGGDVFAARAMEQAIRAHPSKIVAHIDGVAASAATFVSIAASEVEIAPGAMFMIHDSWTLAMGNAEELVSAAALLEKIDGTIADTYAKRTGMPVDELRGLMDAETWFTGQEAVDAGFADRLAEDEPAAKASWNLSAYAKAPSAPTHMTDVVVTQSGREARAASREIAPPPAALPIDTAELRRKLDLRPRTA